MQSFNVSNIKYSPSSFIVSTDKYKFSDDQPEYIRRSREVIVRAAVRIRSAVAQGQDLTQLFFELLDEFCKQRGEIARDAEKNRKIPVIYLHSQNRDRIAQFGRRRDVEGEYEFQKTILDEQYDAFGTKLLVLFQSKLFEMEREKLTKKKWSDTCGEVKSSLEIELLEAKDLNERKWLLQLTAKEFPPYLPLQLIDPRNRDSLSDLKKKEVFEGFRRLKNEQPELYQRSKMSGIFLQLNKEFPSPKVVQEPGKDVQIIGREGNLKSFFLLATARMEINGKMYATSQYVTWLYRDRHTHPYNRMVKDSKALVIHQDRYLIPETLKEIATIFKKAVLAPSVESFATELPHFQHLFAHVMCVDRGAAAINEWFATALAAARECSIEFNQLVDLLGLTNPIYSDFLRIYRDCVKITPWKNV